MNVSVCSRTFWKDEHIKGCKHLMLQFMAHDYVHVYKIHLLQMRFIIPYTFLHETHSCMASSTKITQYQVVSEHIQSNDSCTELSASCFNATGDWPTTAEASTQNSLWCEVELALFHRVGSSVRAIFTNECLHSHDGYQLKYTNGTGITSSYRCRHQCVIFF